MTNPRTDAATARLRPIGLDVLRRMPGWDAALDELRRDWEASREEAVASARAIGTYFRGRRGHMVLDVVTSGYRTSKAALGKATTWQARVEGAGGCRSLAWLVAHPESYRDLGLRRTEPSTIAAVAEGLLRYGRDHGLDDEDAACESWARSAADLELAPKLEPYVGSVSGIGSALLAYCRILCGQDTIKPDVRVLRQLRRFGLDVPVSDAVAGYVVAVAVAAELRISLVELDQFLW